MERFSNPLVASKFQTYPEDLRQKLLELRQLIIDVASSTPDICKTKLVDTFKELYPQLLNFEGNRAITFDARDDMPMDALKHCIALSLQYHKLKHLPLLGA